MLDERNTEVGGIPFCLEKHVHRNSIEIGRRPSSATAVPESPPGRESPDAMDAAMVSDNCPDEQPSDPLKKFVANSPKFKALESIGTSTGRILYPPNTRMIDFSGNIVLLLSNFVPSDNKSISPECFFTLGKEGCPNQSSILMPMRVLGKCMHRYQNFSNDHDAIVANLDTVILTNRTFFGGPKELLLFAKAFLAVATQ
jgi:hypothetical protein